MSRPSETAETCTLCGLSLADARVTNDAGEAFCCAGCRDVAASLDDVDRVDAADVRSAAEDDGTTPDDPPSGHERSFLRVDGMHCTTCEAFLRSVGDATDGVSDVEASYVTETVRVDYDPDRLDESDLAAAFSTAGYEARPRGDAAGPGHGEDGFPWRVALGAMFGMYVMLPYLVYIYPAHFAVLYPEWMLELVRQQLDSARYFFYVLFVFTTLVLAVTGAPLLRGAYVSLRTREPNMDLLVALAATGAYLYSTAAVALGRIDVYYDVTVVIVVAVTAGTYHESKMKRRATELLSDLATAQVDAAQRLGDDGSTTAVDVADLDPGDRVLVHEGDRIPVDGTVREGDCTVDEAVVTGESLPAVKREGDAVVGGSVVVDDAAVVEVGEDAASSLDRIVDLVWNLQSADAGVQKFADALAVVFVPAVVLLSAAAGIGHLALGAEPTAALLVALTVLIVSCPCALGLATPLAVASSIRAAMERGVVVFDETVFEGLRDADAVVFDKTGTLTTGEMEIVDAEAPADLLEAAAALERRSAHPVADAFVAAFAPEEAARTDGGERAVHDESGVTDFRSHATGVEGVVDGDDVLAGHPDLFRERGWSVPDRIVDRAGTARDRGRLPVVVGRDGAAEGVVVAGDEPREGWDDTVSSLSDRGVEVVVLTGDDERAAERFRRHSAVSEVFAGVPPEGKAATVDRLAADRDVAMVGDGTNDAPALARADLGIALGNGTALAAAAADVAVVDDDLASIETVFDVAAAARWRIRENVAWAFLYNAVAIPLALAGHLNPLFAAAAMTTSSALVVANSTRDLLDDPET